MGKGLDSPKKKTHIIKAFAVCLRPRLPAVVSPEQGPVLVSALQQCSGKLEDYCSAEGKQAEWQVTQLCQGSEHRGMWWQPLCGVGREHPSIIKLCTEGGSWEKQSILPTSTRREEKWQNESLNCRVETYHPLCSAPLWGCATQMSLSGVVASRALQRLCLWAVHWQRNYGFYVLSSCNCRSSFMFLLCWKTVCPSSPSFSPPEEHRGVIMAQMTDQERRLMSEITDLTLEAEVKVSP